MVLGDEDADPRQLPFTGWQKVTKQVSSQPSFDKQFAFATGWTSHPENDWTSPQEIVDKTIDKYHLRPTDDVNRQRTIISLFPKECT